VKTPAYDLLEGAIDYAGLYPPSRHPLPKAVLEYLELLSGEGDWLTSRFVCPAMQRDLVAETFRNSLEEFQGDPFPLALVGSPDVASGQFEKDAEALLKSDIVAASAYEIRVPIEGQEAALGGLKKLLKLVEKAEIPVFVELAWNDDLVDAMHRVAEISENIGFKARMGGVIADAFPSPAQVAVFIAEVAALEAPFKFTAGLHEPIRYRDDSIGVMRHGFVNMLVAAGLAVSQFLSAAEIQKILEIEDSSQFELGDESIDVAGHSLTIEGIEEFRGVFGGFGSCSVQEPLDGLARIGWIV
jgi:hypothetical protein